MHSCGCRAIVVGRSQRCRNLAWIGEVTKSSCAKLEVHRLFGAAETGCNGREDNRDLVTGFVGGPGVGGMLDWGVVGAAGQRGWGMGVWLTSVEFWG